MYLDNILKEEMVEEEWDSSGRIKVNINNLKKGDLVKLKDKKYGLIFSDGEYCDDADHGEIYKEIKRFEYIDLDSYYLLKRED